MTYHNLNDVTRTTLRQQCLKHDTVVACLCAAWCDVCHHYAALFIELEKIFPEVLFLWIDIEEQADLVGDFEVENFPTILIERYELVSFYGVVEPQINQLKRLLQMQMKQTEAELKRHIKNKDQVLRLSHKI